MCIRDSPKGAWLKLNSKSDFKSSNVKYWSDLESCTILCNMETCVKLGKNTNFSEFSRDYVLLRANIEPQTPNHRNEHPPTGGKYVMPSQENLTLVSESFRLWSNGVFVSAGQKPCFSQKMDNKSVFGNIQVPAMVLSTKFGFMVDMWDAPFINTSLVDKNLKDFSEHALWIAVLKPIPNVKNSVPVLNVNLQQASPCRTTNRNCGTTLPKISSQAMACCNLLPCVMDLVSTDEAGKDGR